MGIQNKAAAAVLLLAPFAAVAGQGDVIFNSGIEPGLTIRGVAIAPAPMQRAVIQARFGESIATTSANANGEYGLVLEHRHVAGEPLVELRAFGAGEQSHIEWAAQLGPFDRLVAAAGDSVLDVSEEAFVTLSARSTAVTASMWAENGFAPLVDADMFDHAARSQQRAVRDITHALALVGSGQMALPEGTATTWNAVDNLVDSQRLYAAYDNAFPDTPCHVSPSQPFCQAIAALVHDTRVFPLVTPDPDEIHAVSFGYDYWGGSVAAAVRIVGDVGEWHGTGDGSYFQPVVVSTDPDGTLSVARSDGEPLASVITYMYVGGQQVLTHIETTSVRHRFSRGVGGLTEFNFAETVRYRYPNNPELPDATDQYPLNFPYLSTANRNPDALAGALGTLANRRWLLSTPFMPTASPQGFGQRAADIHAFAVAGGVTERGGVTFSLLQQDGDTFTLRYGDTDVETRLVNQEHPGAWRTVSRASGPDGDQVFTGMLMEIQAPPVWSMANAPGTFLSLINAHTCDGPYASLSDLSPYSLCMNLRIVLNPDGTADQGGLPAQWALAGGADAGRLRINRYSGANLSQSRGWEIAKVAGDRIWMIETMQAGTGNEATFVPTERIISYLRQ